MHFANLHNARYIYLFPALILIMAGILKILSPESMAEEFSGFSLNEPIFFIRVIGLIEVIVCMIFIIPKSREIGFLLVTAFVGGIIATEALITESIPIFPMMIQSVLWTGYYLEVKHYQKIEPRRNI